MTELCLFDLIGFLNQMPSGVDATNVLRDSDGSSIALGQWYINNDWYILIDGI